ncbi:MAG: SurA N-terminal domain-containing protein [Deltaproteobacteria bacterium]|nr:SurA N-terminal domain-containing protein [Deltaproteobacteria bacterium]
MDPKRTLLLGCVIFVTLLWSCAEGPSGEGKPIARVNDYVITEDGFRQEVSISARYHNILGLTPEDKREFLNTQIRKELLIQAAVSQGLDKEDEFRQAIEKYWEQFLITALLRREGEQIEKEIVVTREEMEAYYHQVVRKDPKSPPLEQMLPEVERNVREMKKTKALDAWIERLWKDAKITVYEDNLTALK